MEVSPRLARTFCAASSLIGLVVFIALSYHSLLFACLGGAITTFISVSIPLIAKLTAARHPIVAVMIVYALVGIATFCI